MTASAGRRKTKTKENKIMKMTTLKKSLSLVLCIVLIAAMALFTTGCSDTQNDTNSENEAIASQVSSVSDDITVMGEGEKQFYFNVVDIDSNETKFDIRTNKETVGDALLELELIAGDDGDYGLYVKTVNGITADYDTNQIYWAFYVDGEYASAGVDTTEITDGATYSFKVEK